MAAVDCWRSRDQREELKCSGSSSQWKGNFFQTLFLRLITQFIVIYKVIHLGKGGKFNPFLFAIKNNRVPKFMLPRGTLFLHSQKNSMKKYMCLHSLLIVPYYLEQSVHV